MAGFESTVKWYDSLIMIGIIAGCILVSIVLVQCSNLTEGANVNMKGSELHLTNSSRDKRMLKQLQQPAQDRKTSEEIPEIPGAVERFEKLEDEIKKLKKKVQSQETRIQKLMAEKIHRDMRGE